MSVLSTGPFPAVNTHNVHDAGQAQTEKERYAGRIENPSLGTRLRFKAGLMSKAGGRTYRCARLKRNELKLERDAARIIESVDRSLASRRANPGQAIRKVAPKIGKFAHRVEKIHGFNDSGRRDKMFRAVREKYGADISIETIVSQAIGRSLEGRGGLTNDRAVEFIAGRIGGAREGSEDKRKDQVRADNLVVHSTRGMNLERQLIARQVIESFGKAREDDALRKAFTGERLTEQTLSILGKKIREEKERAGERPLSGRLSDAEMDLNGSMDSAPGGWQTASSVPAQPAMLATEQSIARLVDRLSFDERFVLSQLGREFPRDASKPDLMEAIGTIKDVLQRRAMDAEDAFMRYCYPRKTVDLQRLNGAFEKMTPFIVKSFGHGLFANEADVEKGLDDAVRRVVRSSREACGTYPRETQAARLRHYETLAKGVAEKYQGAVERKSYEERYDVAAEIYALLVQADKDLAPVAAEAAAPGAMPMDNGHPVPAESAPVPPTPVPPTPVPPAPVPPPPVPPGNEFRKSVSVSDESGFESADEDEPFPPPPPQHRDADPQHHAVPTT